MLIYSCVNCAFSPIYALSRTHLRGFETTSQASLGCASCFGDKFTIIGKGSCSYGVTILIVTPNSLHSLLAQECLHCRIQGIAHIRGIDFTMSIFIAELGFAHHAEDLLMAKIGVLLASVLAGVSGFLWLFFTYEKGCNPSPAPH
ncbi:MAG: Na+/H+ antiporter NhaA [Pseudomonadota bacterium]